MSDEFRGFQTQNAPEMHRALLIGEQCRKYLAALIRRLGPRVARPVPTAGRDTRGGRDYFFDQIEFYVRGRPERCFIGFYHHGATTEMPGSFFEAWESEHDAEPVVRHELDELIGLVRAAWESGHLNDFLDGEAQKIRHEMAF